MYLIKVRGTSTCMCESDSYMCIYALLVGATDRKTIVSNSWFWGMSPRSARLFVAPVIKLTLNIIHAKVYM